MLTMDVFKQDAFSAVSLSAAIDKMDYVPDLLDGMPGLFVPEPVRTVTIAIEERATGFTILPFSERGTPRHETGGDKGKIRDFRTLRTTDSSTITASELMGIRAFGSETELKSLQVEVARRQFKIKQNFALTKEYHKLNCVALAQVLDADGTIRYDWANEFGQAIPAEIDFDLDNASPTAGALRKKCNQVTRTMRVNLKGVGSAQRIVGLCGDAFYDDFVTHSEVERTYLNWQGAQALRGDTTRPWSTPMRFGDIDWVNYRGADDGSVAVGTDKVRFFPVGAGIFRWAMSPGESFSHVNTLGQDTYSNVIVDDKRDEWARIEVASYPLPVCTMPSALARGRRT